MRIMTSPTTVMMSPLNVNLLDFFHTARWKIRKRHLGLIFSSAMTNPLSPWREVVDDSEYPALIILRARRAGNSPLISSRTFHYTPSSYTIYPGYRDAAQKTYGYLR